jgi:hypothetical protein
MYFDNRNISVQAYPTYEARCPKHGTDMLDLPNGWFSVVWWCEKCEAVYELKVMKMRANKINKENLKEILEERKSRIPHQ